MTEHSLLQIAAIVTIGVGCQWLAWRLRLPSILLLLSAGFLVGPVTGAIDPDKLFGGLLAPSVSLAVGVILFEGGLSLSLRDLQETARPIRNLLVVGTLVTWSVASLAGYLILGLDLRIAILLGAILVVTGPTVVGPLLEQMRPAGKVGPILRWEGIVIDPIGALLAVLVFEAIFAGGVSEAVGQGIVGVVKTLGYGLGIGVVAGFGLGLALRRFWIPDRLQNAVTLALVVGSVAVSNELQQESGLLAAVVMGTVLSNQGNVPTKHIVEFKESLRVLLIGGLFVTLSARLQLDDLTDLGPETIAFVAVLILVGRPLGVMLSTWRSELKWQERVLIASVAPRGIVAAAVASIFALSLADEGVPDAQSLASVTFAAIVGTILVYGLLAVPIARRLKLSVANPQGVLIVGAHEWSRKVATELMKKGFAVMLVDSNWRNIADARMMGLPAKYGSALTDLDVAELDLGGIGYLMALTPNDSVNALCAQRFGEVFERSDVYQLAPRSGTSGSDAIPQDLRGRILWRHEATFEHVGRLFDDGAVIKATTLSEEFPYESFADTYGSNTLPLFMATAGGRLVIISADREVSPVPGDTIIALVPDGEAAAARPAPASVGASGREAEP